MVKYSGCTEAEIIVDYHSPLLSILIKDNGTGFDTQTIFMENGINSMKKRAVGMRASLEIITGSGSGTSILLLVKIK